MLRWLKWIAFVSLLAATVHTLVVTYVPDLIMWRAMSLMGARGGNTVVHVNRATADSRTIVKPSPDLLYSHCVYDVSRAPVKITTAAPTGTYWSVALYAANTDNFFVLNDTAAGAKPATIILLGKDQTLAAQPEGTLIVTPPSPRGLVLFRTLINDDTREPELDRERRDAKCESLSARVALFRVTRKVRVG